jgi:hypothetical protein
MGARMSTFRICFVRQDTKDELLGFLSAKSRAGTAGGSTRHNKKDVMDVLQSGQLKTILKLLLILQKLGVLAKTCHC